MSERTPQPETVRVRYIGDAFDRAVGAINDALDRWNRRPDPTISVDDNGWSFGLGVMFQLEEVNGLTIIDTAALEPGEDDGDE